MLSAFASVTMSAQAYATRRTSVSKRGPSQRSSSGTHTGSVGGGCDELLSVQSAITELELRATLVRGK